jgi:hypothetical protein
MKRKWVRRVLAVLSVLLLGLVIWVGPVIKDLYTHGFFEGTERRKYDGDSAANLHAQYTALMLYHESEDQFPYATGWMDAIKDRLGTNDIAKEDWGKKLIRPDLRTEPGAFGYAMSDEASAKYKGDLKDKKLPLIYESTDHGRNAHAPSASFEYGQAIGVDGNLLKKPGDVR